MKIRQVESKLFQAHVRTDRQTDRDEVNVRFSQLCERALKLLRCQ